MNIAIACFALAQMMPAQQSVTVKNSPPEIFSRIKALEIGQGCERQQAIYTGRAGEISDQYTWTGQGWKIERQWSLHFSKSKKIRVAYTIEPSKSFCSEFTVPAVMYEGNHLGHGNYLKLESKGQVSFREDRVALPSAVFAKVHNRKGGWALFTEPALSEDQLSSLTIDYDGDHLKRASIETPWFEPGPRMLSKGSFFPGTGSGPGVHLWFSAHKNFKYARTFFLHANPDSATSWDTAIAAYRLALDVFHPAVERALQREADDRDVFGARYHYMMAHYYESKDGKVNGFLRSIKQGLLQSIYYDKIEFGFLDRSMDAIRVAWKNGDREPALKSADFLMHAPMRGGLFATSYDIHKNEWSKNELFPKNAFYSARMMGETLEGLLRFIGDIENVEPVRRALYLNFAQNSLRGLIIRQQPDGTFCKYWDASGRCVDFNPTNGAYVVSAMLRLQATHPSAELEASVTRGLNALVPVAKETKFSGDALDSDCIDKEAGVIAMHAFLLALENSRLGSVAERAQWREAALAAGAHVLSWMYLNDVALPERSGLAKFGYTTVGGTSVSVAHQHLDFFGVKIAPEFYRLATQYPEYADVFDLSAKLMVQYSNQLIASARNNYLATGEEWRWGWQPEQQYQTTWTMLPYGLLGLRRGEFFHSLAWINQLQLGAYLDL